MPRDGAGLYSLPAGNPVVTNTVIASAWANTTMSDIAAQLNNVLTRDGLLGPTGPFKIQDGTVAAPGLAFNSEPGLGWYRSGAGEISGAVQGSRIWFLTGASAGISAAQMHPRGAGGATQINLTNQPSGAANFNYMGVGQTAAGGALIQTAAVGTATRGSLTLDAPTVTASGRINSNNASGPGMFFDGGVGNYVTFGGAGSNGAWSWQWTTTTGALRWVGASVQELLLIDGSGNLSIAGQAYKPGGGAWNAPSDIALKENVRDYPQGLDELIALRPRLFNYKTDPSHTYAGLVYQEVESMPELKVTGDNGALMLDPSAITYALINAIKTLHERLSHLELQPA